MQCLHEDPHKRGDHDVLSDFRLAVTTKNHNFKHVVFPFHKFCTAIGGKNELFQFVMVLGKELISCLISVCITISWVCCSCTVAASKLGYKLFLMQWWGDCTVV